MKKLLLSLIVASFLFTGCEQVTNLLAEIESWFVNIQASEIAGTPETEFRFTADTNDTVKGWFIDNAYQENSSVQNLAQFDSLGTHTVEIITENNAYDIVSVEVYETPEVIPDYTITKYYLDWHEDDVAGTDLLYVYDDYVQLNGVNRFYDGFDAFYVGDTKYIKIPITLDHQDEFVTRVDMSYFNIDIKSMTIDEFKIIADIIRRFPKVAGDDSTNTIFELVDIYNP
jgi:hypothetical protein